ncbi:MAG: prolipoprotein diacylglyceryl transferase [Elusimicrobia bacterium]|nr:prolipoprotein diacylglyceryl transferase [Elusimicrobiota bacterium]
MRPVLFSFARFDVLSAPFFAALAVLASHLYFRRRREDLGLSWEDFWGLMLALFLGLLLGGLSVYLLVYGSGPEGNLRKAIDDARVPGGSFFGVFWGAALAARLFCRAKGRPFAPVADTLGGAALLGLVFMRIGCLLNGCCHGKPTSLPWGISFTDPMTRVASQFNGIPLHPSQLYEASAAAAGFLALHAAALPAIRAGRLRQGSAFVLCAGFYAVLRFCTDWSRGSDPGLIRWGGLTTAQLLAMLTLAAAVWCHRAWRKP